MIFHNDHCCCCVLKVAAYAVPGTSLAGDSTWPIGWVQLGPYECHGNVSTIRQSQTDALPASEGWYSNHSTTRLPIPLSSTVPTYDLCSPQPGREQTPGVVGYSCWIHARNKSEVARRLALQLLHTAAPQLAPATRGSQLPAAAKDATGAPEEYSGPVVKTATLIPASDGKSPRVTLTLDHAAGLELSPGQGCVQCCNQVRSSQLALFHRGLTLCTRACLAAPNAMRTPVCLVLPCRLQLVASWQGRLRCSRWPIAEVSGYLRSAPSNR